MKKISPKLYTRLQQLLPKGEILLDAETRHQHSGDKWFAAHEPDAVALPRCVASVSAIPSLPISTASP